MRRAFSSLLAVFGTLWLPAVALADGPEAGLWWSPTLRFTSVLDDNVYSTKTNTAGDVGFWIAPRVEAGYRSEAIELGADVGVDVRQYIDEGNASDELIRAVGFAEVGLAEGLSLRVSDAYVPQSVFLGLPEDDTLNLVQSNRADATLNWTRDLERGRTLNLGVVGTHFLSESFVDAVPAAGGGFVIDPRFRGDYFQGLAFTEVASEIATRTRLWSRTQVSYRDFSKFRGADHTNLSMLVGVDSERWQGFELEATVGGGVLFFDSLGTGYRVLARARVLRRFDSGLSVWLSGRYLTTPDLTGGQVDESRGELGFEQRFGSATALKVRGFLTHYDRSLTGGGSNLFGGGELSLRRQLTRRLQVGVIYRYWENGGAFGADDFAQNRVGLEFGFRL
jgi:hypothetical protein